MLKNTKTSLKKEKKTYDIFISAMEKEKADESSIKTCCSKEDYKESSQ